MARQGEVVPDIAGAAHNGGDYDRSSTTQTSQGSLLVAVAAGMRAGGEFPEEPRVADIGCGNGKMTINICEQLPAGSKVFASDISPTQIEVAKKNLEAARNAGTTLPRDIWFYVAGATDIGRSAATQNLDYVFSNAALHWVREGRAYGPIYRAMRKGGALVVHQGGEGCYRGLASAALRAAAEIGIGEAFTGWDYPLYYPSVNAMRQLLRNIGFSRIILDSVESDGREHPNLPSDYAYAGLLPFIERAGEKGEALRGKYLEIATQMQADGELDTYTHCLYIMAKK